MALSPLDNTILDEITPETGGVIDTSTPVQPTRTYSLDFDNGEIGGIVDGESAIRQFIRKAVVTARFRFLIYDDEYGCELDDLIGQDLPLPLLEAEIPRVITEALIYDDRVDDVDDFIIYREGDQLYIEFTVYLTDGTQITESVVR